MMVVAKFTAEVPSKEEQLRINDGLRAAYEASGGDDLEIVLARTGQDYALLGWEAKRPRSGAQGPPASLPKVLRGLGVRLV